MIGITCEAQLRVCVCVLFVCSCFIITAASLFKGRQGKARHAQDKDPVVLVGVFESFIPLVQSSNHSSDSSAFTLEIYTSSESERKKIPVIVALCLFSLSLSLCVCMCV